MYLPFILSSMCRLVALFLFLIYFSKPLRLLEMHIFLSRWGCYIYLFPKPLRLFSKINRKKFFWSCWGCCGFYFVYSVWFFFLSSLFSSFFDCGALCTHVYARQMCEQLHVSVHIHLYMHMRGMVWGWGWGQAMQETGLKSCIDLWPFWVAATPLWSVGLLWGGNWVEHLWPCEGGREGGGSGGRGGERWMRGVRKTERGDRWVK